MRKLISAILVFMALMMIGACSTKKNTALTRRVQAFKANYNTYYNGTLAFKDGLLAQEQGNKDNCTEIIPVYINGNKATEKLGSGNYSTAIEKCQKTIKLHTITKRPEWKGKKKTEKDKIWLSQKEYNPFLYKAWFLMGAAQFAKGEYVEAASTYSYMQRLYFSKPDIIARARMLEAKCYAEIEWFYDAEDIIRRAERDSFPTNLQNLKAEVLADLQVRQKKYEEAIPNLQKALKKEKRNYQKARLNFLLGQLCHKVGRDQEAYKYFGKVIKKNPPYELEFNARIKRTEVMQKGNSKQVIKKLKSMARNPKNADFLDQVYYAIGNVYLAEGDTTRAIWAYNDGMQKATRSSIEKGVLMVHLGQLYWEKEEFVKAKECYSGALGLFDKDHDDYKEIDRKAKTLEELYPFASAVELQDSLQELAQMDSVKRMEVIKKIIEEVKKKEKEEAKKAAESNNPNANQGNRNQQNNQPNNRLNPNQQQQGGTFYFYNPTTVSAGKTEFQRKWGQRKLEDNWRRLNKTVLSDFNEVPEDSIEGDSLMNDSLQQLAHVADSIKAAKMEGLTEKEKKELEKLEEYQQDPHRPEYYLKDIPFTEEQMAASNEALVAGLFGAAPIYKDQMENFELAERTYKRIMDNFPDFDKYDEIYYNLWQLYSRMGKTEEAETYRQKLLDEFAENEHSKQLADPNFLQKAMYGKAIEDSLYTAAYEAFKASDYQSVISGNEYSAEEYPSGDNRARFMFISAMSKLELGQRDGFMNNLKEIVEKYPNSTVSELAGLYVKGLKEGRLLASGKFETGSIWERRRSYADADSLASDTLFTNDKNCDWTFAIAYERDSISENQLLFEMARYNFTNFSVRNFDIEFQKGDGIDMMLTRTFLNYEEAYIYLHKLMNNDEMAHKLEGLKCFIISEDNLKKLQKGLSFADYFDYYDDNFDRIGHLKVDENLLDEPTEYPEPKEEEEEDFEEEDNYIF